MESVLARLAGKKTSAALPLDVRATAFQGRVWRALQEIPAGETMSYGAIAEMITNHAPGRAPANWSPRAAVKTAMAEMHPCCAKAVAEGKGCCGKDAAGLKAAFDQKAADAKAAAAKASS